MALSLSDLKIRRAAMTNEANEGLSAIDPRAHELAYRLMAPGPKACAVSESECHEIAEYMLAVYGPSQPGIVATHEAADALIEIAEKALAWQAALNERQGHGERAYLADPMSILTPEHRARSVQLDRQIRDRAAALCAALARVRP